MPTITFKNVGQGDSVILEWDDDATKKIAIIDCKKTDKSNPVIDHIKKHKYRAIEFIILSHPHDDHYSGLFDLLVFLESENIAINWFGHTIDKISKEYWKLFEPSHSASRLLEQIISKIIELRKKGLIKNWEYPFKNWQMKLADNINIHALSPSHDEIEQYQKKVKLDGDANKREAGQAANLLSTIFKITINGSHILITSDAQVVSLERLYNEEFLISQHFSLIQVPHHGSINNYSPVFWDNVLSKKIAIISAGYNLKYKHPNFEVLENLSELDYKIRATNQVHGMAKYVRLKRKSLALDLISKFDEESIGGDKEFTF